MAITDPARTRRNQKPWLPATLALLLIFVVTSCAFPQEGSSGNLDGTYYMNGVDRDGVEYSGTLVIAATASPDVYDMQWIITGSIQTGTGTVDGNSVVIEWAAMEGFDSASHGGGHYNVSADGELTGERTVADQEGVATEEAFPIR